VNSISLLRAYYAATLLFVLLDYALGISVRVSFFDALPVARMLYYLLCFVCLALIVWRPGWALLVGTVESLLALSLLIIAMGVRVMTISEQVLEGGAAPVTAGEIVNFALVGGAAWLSWQRGSMALRNDVARPPRKHP